MNDENTYSRRVLVAPLNWGLGHASRCVPLVRHLRSRGVEVMLASDGEALQLLRAEFPDLRCLELPSYRIRYKSENMVRNMAWQLPRIYKAIRDEHKALRGLASETPLDGIISDNRYGCFLPNVPNVLLTHQLAPIVPGKFYARCVKGLVERALARFDAIWVPDVAESPGLSGRLSHLVHPIHPKVQYLGLLSRMDGHIREHEYDLIAVLSGPEPQRTYLEQVLLEQLLALEGRFLLVQGKTRAKTHHFAAEHVEVVSYLTSADLCERVAASRAVVCRSGYSSLMDLAVMGKKAIVVPTPGQTEQEYLAEALSAQGTVVQQRQNALDLRAALTQLPQAAGFRPKQWNQNAFVPVLDSWLASLGERRDGPVKSDGRKGE
jgi:UDP:flavonoid glycosyltransferase YjiC (YdhE family)